MKCVRPVGGISGKKFDVVAHLGMVGIMCKVGSVAWVKGSVPVSTCQNGAPLGSF